MSVAGADAGGANSAKGAAPRRRRRGVIVLVVVLVLLALVAVGLVIADNAARDSVEEQVATQLRGSLSLPADARLDVETGGFSMLLQLAAGRLDEVRVRADEVDFGGLTGPAALVARGVPLDQKTPVDELTIRFAASESSLTSLSANLSGLPITSVTTDGDEIDVSAEFEVLFVTLPLGVGLEPRAEGGQIAFEPTSIRLNEAVFSVQDLRDRFGRVAEDALRTQNLCIAEYLPAAFVLQDVALTDDSMVLTFDGSGAVLDEASLSGVGRC